MRNVMGPKGDVNSIILADGPLYHLGEGMSPRGYTAAREEINMKCQCGQPTMYKEECRDCYENRLRREARDEYDRNIEVRLRRMIQKEWCNVRRHRTSEVPKSIL